MDNIQLQNKNMQEEAVDIFDGMNLFQLRDLARQKNIDISNLLTQEDIKKALKNPNISIEINKNNTVNHQSKSTVEFTDEDKRLGVLDIMEDGYGFLRTNNCEVAMQGGLQDVYISKKIIKDYKLRKGDVVECYTRQQSGKSGACEQIITINSMNPIEAQKRPIFEQLVPIFPDERLKLFNGLRINDYAIRAIDIVAPIGRGQRAMIVSPPKAGKTTLLKKIANAITEGYPDITLFVLLIDERPEEVTDMQRNINGEVIYSTFDETPEHHTKAAELVIERAKRLVEYGKNVVIIMDSLTRLARAYNLVVPPSGRTLSGGIDPVSLHAPKRFFGAARNIENGGSLTIIATALVDTGSRMDDVIYEEFKGTGNMEIHLDRRLSERRIFPAIDLYKSGTRRDDLLLNKEEKAAADGMRRFMSAGDINQTTQVLIDSLVKTKSTAEFFEEIKANLKEQGTYF